MVVATIKYVPLNGHNLTQRHQRPLQAMADLDASQLGVSLWGTVPLAKHVF